MEIFAVIKILQYYEEIADVVCLNKFFSEEDANNFIAKIQEKATEEWKTYCAYVENYVNEKIEVPESPNYEEWKRFLTDFPYYQYSPYVTPKNFKKNLISDLRLTHLNIDREDYQPPTVDRNHYSYYVVKI
jgi:hypothetical protein